MRMYHIHFKKKHNKVIPPFHHGLMLQMHHKFGCKILIEILNSYGFSWSYDDLRSFPTSAAERQLEENVSVYVPSVLVHREAGGSFIQEGDDNVYINTETIDGRHVSCHGSNFIPKSSSQYEIKCSSDSKTK